MPKISQHHPSNIQCLLDQGLQQLKLTLTLKQKNQLLNYLNLLLKWNHAYNLVATQNAEEILIAHILDSLSITAFIEGKNIFDFGSGAGFPGIPLSIVFPEKKFTLLDSIRKKTSFLMQVKIELGLSNIAVAQDRAENFKSTTCFDVIVTRAVAPLEEIITNTQHLLCRHGKMLAMKGLMPTTELQQMTHLYKIVPLHVPFLNKERHIVIIYPYDYCAPNN